MSNMYSLSDFDLEKTTPERLGEILIEAKKAYYTTGKPIMDDHTYDTLEEVLKKKSPYHRLFSKVGHENFDTGWEKKAHSMPMGSQNKVSTYDDLVHYFELKNKSSPFLQKGTEGGFLVQPKCDGISLEIEYKNGQLLDAITRGDGHTGDVITQNVVKMKNLVLSLSKDFTGSVRCEIVVTKKDFEKLNEKSEEKYSNSRNAASGLSQRLDGKYSKLCSLYATDIFVSKEQSRLFPTSRPSSISQPFSTEIEKIKFLKSLGFTPVESHLCQSFTEIEKIYQNFLQETRKSYPYDIDGLVIKINDLEITRNLGQKNGRPKYQVAYKFPAESNQSQIKKIVWQVGPLGSITPVAEIEPVEISGAIINFASLGNYDLVIKKNLNEGDIIEISRRGDVIPHIEKVITKVVSGHVKVPQNCPACNTLLVREEKILRCPNIHGCLPQILGSLQLFCHKLDILGLSEKTIQKLYDSGTVRLPGDFYKLKVSDIKDLENLGEKSAKNIINQIQNKKNLTLRQVFDSAAIPNFSSARIKQVIEAGFNTPEKLLNITSSDLLKIKGFKQTLAQKIVEGIKLRHDWIKSILNNVETRQWHVSANKKLSNLSFAITGTLFKPRQKIVELIENNGGKVLSSVTQNTDYLISNESNSNSSKFVNAKKFGIKIINEEEFNKMLK
ncbi:MAG: NAD-dependent DNA ligase LigA [Candidatus Shapirobacteria bacterium]|nr:NAD-dependent DNA ligase LigA [Candidatus Woesebacteria bacterium]